MALSPQYPQGAGGLYPATSASKLPAPAGYNVIEPVPASVPVGLTPSQQLVTPNQSPVPGGGAMTGADITAALNAYLGSSDWQGGVAGGSALPTVTTWSTTWDTAAYKDMGSYTVAGALALTSSDTSSVRGGCTQAVLIADGTNVPTLDGAAATAFGYVNTSGARNLVQLFRAGDAKFWACGAYVGAILSTPTAPSWPSAPSIGAATVGVATSVTGSASGSAAITYTYQWTLDGANIGGATASSYTPVFDDATKALRCIVTATNDYGSANGTSNASTVSAAATVPGAPTALTLGTATSTTQPLSWTAPASDGGSSLTDYVVQWSPAGAGTWTTFVDGVSTATSATVTGLTASTNYDYRVAAVNAIGTSSYSSTATGSTGAATSLVNAQLTTVAGITQSGDASAGWTYTCTAANASFSGSQGGVTSLKIPSGAGGYFQAKLDGWSTGNAFHIGLKTTGATGAFGTAACGLYGRSTNVYNVSTGVTGSQTPTGGALAVTNGDMLRVGRDADGTTCNAYKSSDNGATWTLMHTWAGISGNLYCLLNFGGLSAQAVDVEGFGVI